MAAIFVYSDTDKERGSNFPDLFMDREIAIRKQGKRYIVGIFKIADLESRIPDTDTHQLDPSFETFIRLDDTVHIVDSGSLPLAEGSVHTEDLNDDDLGDDLRNFK